MIPTSNLPASRALTPARALVEALVEPRGPQFKRSRARNRSRRCAEAYFRSLPNASRSSQISSRDFSMPWMASRASSSCAEAASHLIHVPNGLKNAKNLLDGKALEPSHHLERAPFGGSKKSEWHQIPVSGSTSRGAHPASSERHGASPPPCRSPHRYPRHGSPTHLHREKHNRLNISHCTGRGSIRIGCRPGTSG